MKRAGANADVDGATKIAQILHHVDYATEKRVLGDLSARRPDLASSIHSRMFIFEDIARVPVGLLRSALEAVESEELAIALRMAGEDVKKKVLASLPGEVARGVREEMNHMGPVRLGDIEAAQRRVMEAVLIAERGRYVVEEFRRNPSEVVA